MPEDQGAPEGPARLRASTIYRLELDEALGTLERPWPQLAMSALAAGLEIGFSTLLIAVVRQNAEGVLPEPVVRLLVASMYSVGFLLVVLGRSELFTEQTTLAVLPLLRRKRTVGELGKLWAVVLAGNVVGAAAFAALVTIVAPSLGVASASTFDAIARRIVSHDDVTILLSAVLAGWLMGLLSWLVAASRESISQIVTVFVITGAIGLAELHHSVAGSVEVLAGVFVHGTTTLADYGRFLLFSVLGNAIGGTVFVALLKWAHTSPSREEEPA